jgi:hypothetical protein
LRIANSTAISLTTKQVTSYSTIIVKTDSVTFHIDYKQENGHCNAHSLDVWMANVSPSVLLENWEGVIGETKEETDEKKDKYDRKQVLKYADDSAYEVNSPLAARDAPIRTSKGPTTDILHNTDQHARFKKIRLVMILKYNIRNSIVTFLQPITSSYHGNIAAY